MTSRPGEQQATFDASASTAGAGSTIADYRWSWGDGSPPEDDGPQTPVVTHTYAKSGQYAVTLTVINSSYKSATSAPQTVTVIPPAPAPAASNEPAPLYVLPSPPGDRSATHVLQRVSFAHARLTVTLSCPPTKVSCAGTVRFETARAYATAATTSARKKGKGQAMARRLLLGRAAFDLAGGRTVELTFSFSAQGRSLLDRLRRLPVVLVVAAHDPDGDPGTATERLTLLAPSGPHKAAKQRALRT